MKTYILTALVCMAAAGICTTGCKKQNPAAQVRDNGLPKAGSKTDGQGVVYVDIDTLQLQYTYCKEGQKKLESKQEAYRKQLNAKGQALQNALMAYQKKMQSGAFTSQQQAEAAQSGLQRQQQQLQQYQQQVEEDMAKAAEAYNKALRDSVNNFLRDFNADGRYKMILSRSGDNVLYADPALDITQEVGAGLNQRDKKK